MTRVFFRTNLQYDARLPGVFRSLLDFWLAEETHFPRQQSVLIKPNLLSPRTPEHAITTHPEIVRQVVHLLKDFGNKIYIADSPAGGSNKDIPRLWERTGMAQVARETGAELININARGLVEKKGLQRNFFFTDLLNEVEYLVNLPKLKTHGLTLLTGAIKNVFGLIPGIQKGVYHLQFPKPEQFAENLVDIFAAIRPHFHIMDGIQILEGNGPSSGGKIRYAGFLLAGKDAVAVDSVAARSLGIDPRQVDTIRFASQKKLGEADPEKIRIVGDEFRQISIEIPAPQVFSRLPDFTYAMLRRFIWTRPRANPERCSGCGLCINNCPVQAMSPNENGIPEIDYQSCINCFCCAEVCPEDAIYQESSRLVRWLS